MHSRVDARLVVGALGGVDPGQVQALAEHLDRLRVGDGRLTLTLTEDGALHVQIDQPDLPTRWVVVGEDMSVTTCLGSTLDP